MKKENIVLMIDEAKNGWEYYKSSLKPCVDAYFMVLDKDTCDAKKRQKRSHLYFPKVTAKARRVADALSQTYFSSDELAKLSSFFSLPEDVLKKWQKAMEFYTVKQNMYLTFQPINQEVAYMGTAVVKVYWGDDELKIDKVDLEDFWFDPNAKSNSDVRYLVHSVYLSKDEIKALQKKGHFSKKVSIEEYFSENSPNERFKIHEVYFLENGIWKVTSVYEGSLFLREGVKLKDGHPFIWGGLVWQTKKFDEENFIPCYFEPSIASMIPLQDETNAVRNMINDGVRQHLHPKFITSKTDGINRSELESIGEPITSSNPGGIRTLDMPNLAPAMSLVPIIEQDMSEVTGVSPQQNGIAPNRRETATMSSIMSNEGSVRLQGYIRTFNETFFEPCFQRAAVLVWKYAREDFFIGVNRDEIPSFEVKVSTGIGALNKEVQRQGLIEANSLLAQYFQMCLAVGDEEGAREILEASKEIVKQTISLYGVTDIKGLLKDRVDKDTLTQFRQGGFGSER